MAAERFSESFKGVPPIESDRILKLRPGKSVRQYERAHAGGPDSGWLRGR